MGKLARNQENKTTAHGDGPPPGFRLIDGEQMHRQYPDRFWIPDFRERWSLSVDDAVKIGLIPVVREVGDLAGERLWARITKVTVTGPPGRNRVIRYTATLNNRPLFEALHYGDVVVFGPEHVLDCEVSL